MVSNYLELIKNIELFRGLDEKSLANLLSSFSFKELDENEILFSQDEKVDSMYVVLSGYLIALRKTKDRHITVGKIHAGEVVGEMGLFTQKPRSLTIKALTPSKLMVLSVESFLSFIKLNPDAIPQILTSVLYRSYNAIDILSRTKSNIRYIFLTSTNEKMLSHTCFIENLKKSISKHRRILFLEEAKLKEMYHSHGLDALLHYLDKLEPNHNTIIYHIEQGNEPSLNNVLLAKTNLFAIIALGNTPPVLSAFNLQLLQRPDLSTIEKKLILLWPDNFHIQNTRHWLKLANFNLHHHIPLNDHNAYERLLRFLCGNPIGLVLSGGGFRGFTHLGVIKALNEKNIPIDAIGGTSVGAAVAAYYACAKNYDELLQQMTQAANFVRKSLKWNALTFPAISIYSAAPTSHFTKISFNSQRIEDLLIPYFGVSCNINTNREVVFHQGKIWRAVRASAALPGIFPPLIDNGQLLYDGGLMNNFPTDRMQELLGSTGIIFASDLGTMAEDKLHYTFPDALPPLHLLQNKHSQNQHYVFPPFFSTIIRAMLIGSFPKYQANIRLAHYYIHPDLSAYDTALPKESTQEEMMQLGYSATLAILKNWNYDE